MQWTLSSYATNDIACKIYKQTILPLLDHADFLIESARSTSVSCLFHLQEKAVQYIDYKANKKLSYDGLCTIYNKSYGQDGGSISYV